MKSRAHAAVPATSANLGTGFDCMGMALDHWDELIVDIAEKEDFIAMGSVEVKLAFDKSNWICTTFRITFQLSFMLKSSSTAEEVIAAVNAMCDMIRAELSKEPEDVLRDKFGKMYDSWISSNLPPLRYTYIKNIPVSRGLGSSAAAIVLGLLAGFDLFEIPIAQEMIKPIIFHIACTLEGHGDNAAPTIFGGLNTVWSELPMEREWLDTLGCSKPSTQLGGLPVLNTFKTYPSWHAKQIFVKKPLLCITFIPHVGLLTSLSRSCLPSMIPRKDSVSNTARVALLVNALNTGAFEELFSATQDVLHQPPRANAYIPYFYPVCHAALRQGAAAAYMSGAGPTIIALAPCPPETATDQQQPSYVQAIADAMLSAAAEFNTKGTVLIVKMSEKGAHLK